MTEPLEFAPSGELFIAYDVHGDADDPVLVLVAGLGSQLVFYEDELVQGFVDRSFRVVRLDNRDSGRSSSVDGGPSDPALVAVAAAAGTDVAPAYRFADMAGDVVAVLDHLGVGSAHVLGTSLGGMVAQVLAIGHPDRVRSLTLLSSTSGHPGVGQPTPTALEALLRPSPEERDAAIAHDVEVRRVWATPEYYEPEWARRYFTTTFDRGRNPEGTGRQMVALLCEADREPDLRALRIPTLVLHGTADPLVAPSGGERLAELIPDAELVVLDGMAHDLPPHYWSQVIEAVTRLAIRAG